MNHQEHGPADTEYWDGRYGEADQMWSGRPNGALLAEVSGLAPGRALDVGCGEGADAIWLAEHGWQVTALDVSGVALARAKGEAERRGLTLTYVQDGLVEAALPAGSFELVIAFYPVLFRTDELTGERALLDAVAPGGTLLVVHHEFDRDHMLSHGFDPDLYVSPADVKAALGEAWQVEVWDRRERHVTSGRGSGHTMDVVLKARRTAG